MKPGLCRFIASMLMVSFASVPLGLLAQGARGANLVVALKDGPSVTGELIAVKQNSLLLLSPVGKDETVELYRISTITVARKSKAGSGFLIGFLLGGIVGGLWGHHNNAGDPDMEGLGTAAGVLLVGSVAGLVGLGIGAAAGSDETIEFAGLSEGEAHKVLDRLRGMARMRTAQ